MYSFKLLIWVLSCVMILIGQSVYRFEFVISINKYNITIYPLFTAVITVEFKIFPLVYDPRRR